MLENIAMWGGLAGLVVSVFAIVILCLTRYSITDLLNKDVLLSMDNLEIKKNAIVKAMNIVDEISEKGENLKNSSEFILRANDAYNNLLCVISDVRVADQFYAIAIDEDVPFNSARNAQFKILCRNDLGLNIKDSMLMKKVKDTKNQIEQPINNMQPKQNVQQSQNIQPQHVEVATQPGQPVASQPRPMQSQMQRPVAPQPRPVARPTTTQSQRPTTPQQKPVVKPTVQKPAGNPQDKK